MSVTRYTLGITCFAMAGLTLLVAVGLAHA